MLCNAKPAIARSFQGSVRQFVSDKLQSIFFVVICPSQAALGEDSLVNAFNRDEKESSPHSRAADPPPIPPLSCILYIPLEQMFTCSRSAFNSPTGRCED